MKTELTVLEKERYSKMRELPEMGEQALRILKQSSVLVIGAGGLGSAVIPSLAASGVGHLGIAEFDIVTASNLQRQLLYTPEEIGQKKIQIASARVKQLNPEIALSTYDKRLDESNAVKLLEPYQLIVDCTDNFRTRYLINDTCSELNKSLVYGSIGDYDGMVTLLHHQKKINLRDIFPKPPENPVETGIIPTLPLIVGSLQANEVIKTLTGAGDNLDGKLLTINVLTNNVQLLKI